MCGCFSLRRNLVRPVLRLERIEPVLELMTTSFGHGEPRPALHLGDSDHHFAAAAYVWDRVRPKK
jgi:hypothetical protein